MRARVSSQANAALTVERVLPTSNRWPHAGRADAPLGGRAGVASSASHDPRFVQARTAASYGAPAVRAADEQPIVGAAVLACAAARMPAVDMGADTFPSWLDTALQHAEGVAAGTEVYGLLKFAAPGGASGLARCGKRRDPDPLGEARLSNPFARLLTLAAAANLPALPGPAFSSPPAPPWALPPSLHQPSLGPPTPLLPPSLGPPPLPHHQLLPGGRFLAATLVAARAGDARSAHVQYALLLERADAATRARGSVSAAPILGDPSWLPVFAPLHMLFADGNSVPADARAEARLLLLLLLTEHPAAPHHPVPSPPHHHHTPCPPHLPTPSPPPPPPQDLGTAFTSKTMGGGVIKVFMNASLEHTASMGPHHPHMPPRDPTTALHGTPPPSHPPRKPTLTPHTLHVAWIWPRHICLMWQVLVKPLDARQANGAKVSMIQYTHCLCFDWSVAFAPLSSAPLRSAQVVT